MLIYLLIVVNFQSWLDIHTVAVAKVDGHIGSVEEIIGEEFLDQISLIAEANDEVVESAGRNRSS